MLRSSKSFFGVDSAAEIPILLVGPQASFGANQDDGTTRGCMSFSIFFHPFHLLLQIHAIQRDALLVVLDL